MIRQQKHDFGHPQLLCQLLLWSPSVSWGPSLLLHMTLLVLTCQSIVSKMYSAIVEQCSLLKAISNSQQNFAQREKLYTYMYMETATVVPKKAMLTVPDSSYRTFHLLRLYVLVTIGPSWPDQRGKAHMT